MNNTFKKLIALIMVIFVIAILPVSVFAAVKVELYAKNSFLLSVKIENEKFFETEEFKNYLNESDETKYISNLIAETHLILDGKRPTAKGISIFSVELTEERDDILEIVKAVNNLSKVDYAEINAIGFTTDYIMGDVDENHKIQAADARLCLRASVGLEELNIRKLFIADVDENGFVDASDAREILRRSVGLK